MIFEWDQTKSERNAANRQLPFDIAVALFDGPTLEALDERRDDGERRVRAVGAVRGVCMVCVHTDRGDIRRIISLRLASRKERDGYRATLPS